MIRCRCKHFQLGRTAAAGLLASGVLAALVASAFAADPQANVLRDGDGRVANRSTMNPLRSAPGLPIANDTSTAQKSGPAVSKDAIVRRDQSWIEGRKLAKANQPDESLAKYEQALEIQRHEIGMETAAACTLLAEIANCRFRHGDFRDSLTTSRELEALSSKVLGPKHWRTVDARLLVESSEKAMRLKPEQRASVVRALERSRESEEQFRDQKYEQARDSASAAADMLNEALGADDSFTCNALHELGVAQLCLSEIAVAKVKLEKCVAIRERLHGASNPRTLASLRELAGCHKRQNDFEAATIFYTKVLTGRRAVDGPKSAPTLSALRDLTTCYFDSAQYEKAEPQLVELLKLQHETTGKSHSDEIETLEKLEKLAAATKQTQKEIDWRTQALTLLQNSADIKPDIIASKLLALGTIELTAKHYDTADGHLKQAVELLKQVKGESHSDSLIALQIYATNLNAKGDKAGTERAFRQMLQIATKTSGENSLFAGRALLELAHLYDDWGDDEKAETYSRRALEAFRNTPETTPDDLVPAMIELASVLSDLKRFHEVDGLLAEAKTLLKSQPQFDIGLFSLVSTFEQVSRQAHNDRKTDVREKPSAKVLPQELGDASQVVLLTQQAVAAFENSDYEGALNLVTQAIELEKAHHTQAENWWWVFTLAGIANSGLDRHAEAKSYFDEALRIARKRLEEAATVQSERQQLIFSDHVRMALECYLSLPENMASPEETYSHLLLWKGAIQGRRMRSAAERQGESSQLDVKLQGISKTLAALLLQAPDAAERDRWQRTVDQLRSEKDDLEAEIARLKSAGASDKSKTTPVNVRAALPGGTALIDIVECDPYNFGKPDDPEAKAKTARRYLAFISRSDRELVRIDLGPASAIDDAIETWRTSCLFASDAYQKPAAFRLRELIWTPLETHLEGCETVLIAPDGQISRLPIGALPGKSANYLIEEYAIGLIPVPQLLPDILKANPVANNRAGDSLLVVGNINYDATPDDANSGSTTDQISRESRSGSEMFSFEPLRSAPAEVRAMQTAFNERYPNGDLKVLDQAAATESAFRREAPRHRSLFLATHGFFAPPGVAATLASTDERSARALTTRIDHSGVLSGLALAGANVPKSAGDDGILTAYEVASLDLRAVELAVLSGCQTGLGELSPGEGALGLQRAFQVAGAKTTVASLWNVPDLKTSCLMQRFYANLWDGRFSKLESLREAQIWLMHNDGGPKKSDGKAKNPPGRLAPYHWAAFQVSGDWR